MASDVEKQQLVSELSALNSEQRSEFFSRHELGSALTSKGKFQRQLFALVDAGKVPETEIIQFLDEVMPWGKQHVYLFKGPDSSISKWKSPVRFRKILTQGGAEHFLDGRRELGMPQDIEISSIQSSTKLIRIEAVRGRFWWDRDKSLDEKKVAPTGAPVELRAFVQRGLRNLVIFEWDLRSNIAMLQISQLQSGTTYESVRAEFFALASNLIPVGQSRI